MSTRRQTFNAISEYLAIVDQVYGYYIDSVVGFEANVRRLVASQEGMRSHFPPEFDQDLMALTYGRTAPTDPNAKAQHITSQGEYKARNKKGGRNHFRAAEYLVVMLYQYWESKYRAAIANARGIDPDDVKVPVIGDLRVLRIDILHHRAIVRQETAQKLQIFKRVIAGQRLTLTHNDVEILVDTVKASLNDLLDNLLTSKS
jgi:hypothetical protein